MSNNSYDLDDLDQPAQGGPAGPGPGDYLQFLVGAVRRHHLLTLGVFLACLAVLGGYYAWKTPQYRVETRILAQRQQSLPSIVRSHVPEDQPTRAAWEIIHRRDNLIALVTQAGLLEAPPELSPLGRLRQAPADQGAPSRAGEPSPPNPELLDELVLALDKRLLVEAGEVTIAIELDWPDPQQAYRIVDGALQNFLEARHLQEVTALDEPIATLQGRAAVLREELAVAIESTRRAVMQETGRVLPAAVAQAQARPPSEELVRLRSMLEAKERAIGDVEEFRRRRLAELQAQYDARRTVYSEKHPEIITLRQDIAALTRDSPQITGLREEERRLRQEYQARAAREPGAAAAVPAAPPSAARISTEGLNAAVEQSERVREARRRYQEVMESLNAAQLELDTARSAFKHRYKVIWPAQVPKEPFSPKPWKIFGVGGLGALLLALLVAAAVDLRSGRIYERWQIERSLRLPIIAETSDR